MLETVLYYLAVEPRLLELSSRVGGLLLFLLTIVNIIFAAGYLGVIAVYLIGDICPELVWSNPFLLIRLFGTVGYYCSYGLFKLPKEGIKSRSIPASSGSTSSLVDLKSVQQ